MTQVFRQKTVGEQGRVYSRRPQTEPARAASETTVAASETADAPPASTDKNEHQALRDLDVGELLLEQFGPVYVADANFDLIYVTEGFKELARDAWGFEVDLAGDAAAPTPLRNVLESLAETGHFEPNRTDVRRSGMTRLYLGRHFISERDQGRLFYGYFEDVTRNTTLEKSWRKRSRNSTTPFAPLPTGYGKPTPICGSPKYRRVSLRSPVCRRICIWANTCCHSANCPKHPPAPPISKACSPATARSVTVCSLCATKPASRGASI
jgi:hypothetical protein